MKHYVKPMNFEKIQFNMAKVLRVIEPFFDMDVDDTFVLTDDGKSYVFEKNEEFHTNSPEIDDMTSTFKSTFKISTKWAKQLVEDGYLEEVNEKNNSKFVNVFDEIEKLLNAYQTELKELPTTMKESPECLKVERTTVLSNMIKVLSYLKTLRK
jgi:hypothetical protein